jgi:phosphinothricin acetyltransferase
MIRAATTADAAAIVAIYNHYIKSTTVTFEETALAAPDMAQRIANVSADFPWLVLEREARIVGYAYASRFHARSAYRFTVETTVYVAHDAHRGRIGTELYGALLERLRAQKLHSALGVIALPNDASVGLHEKLGFRKVGETEEVGWKFGRWINVGYWQLAL